MGRSSTFRRSPKSIYQTKSEEEYDPCTSNMLKISNRLVFERDSDNDPFKAKFKLENLSCRYVAFVVRSSVPEHFKIRPKYGFLSSRQVQEISIESKNIETFPEICKEAFAVYAVPIYDKRQLDQRKLNLLWKVHGTDLFPFKAAEAHRISHILPKSDSYYDELPLVGRLSEMSYIRKMFRYDEAKIREDVRPVDEETFHFYWPKEGTITDPNLDRMIEDWHETCRRIQEQTKSVIDSVKVFGGILFSSALTIAGMTYCYVYDAVPFGAFTISGINTTVTVPSSSAAQSVPLDDGLFSWISLLWNSLV